MGVLLWERGPLQDSLSHFEMFDISVKSVSGF